MVTKVLYFLLFVFLAMFVYWFIDVIIELKKRDFVGTVFNSISKKYEDRQVEKEAKELYEGSLEQKRFIDKIDTLFQRSGIKKIFPFLTSELLVISTLVLALVISIIVSLITKFWLYTIAAFVLVIFAVVLCLKIAAKVTFNRIDKQILTYINTLKNISKTNDDIVTIFEKSIPYLRNPLREYISQFVLECKHGIPLEDAFKNLKDKIESKRFEQLLTNVHLCSKHNANYNSVFDEGRKIFNHYFSAKLERTYAVKNGIAAICLMCAVGALVFYMLQTFTGDIMTKLRYTTGGNILLGYFLVVFIYTIYKLVTLDSLNY